MSLKNKIKQIKRLSFDIDKYPDVVSVANELAVLESRKPHDVIHRLVTIDGRAKIERLKNSTSQIVGV